MSKSVLAITEDHHALDDAAFGQLNRLGGRAAGRATLESPGHHPSELWSAGADLGWNGLAVAEEYGGSGFDLSELAVVAEVAGRKLCPGPFPPTGDAHFNEVFFDDDSFPTLRYKGIPGQPGDDHCRRNLRDHP